jgi:hypothetical protein
MRHAFEKRLNNLFPACGITVTGLEFGSIIPVMSVEDVFKFFCILSQQKYLEISWENKKKKTTIIQAVSYKNKNMTSIAEFAVTCRMLEADTSSTQKGLDVDFTPFDPETLELLAPTPAYLPVAPEADPPQFTPLYLSDDD